jgi:RNA polymerase sigma-70 factor (ECF subfamily)
LTEDEPHDPLDVSLLLRDVGAGGQPPEELFQAVYDELHGLASRHMLGERVDHTLQPTILVHEAWMRLGGNEQVGWEGRAHFFGAAGQAMRRILVDHARKRAQAKRGGGAVRLPLDALELVRDDDVEAVIAVDDAVTALERHDPRLAEIVRLRFWAGLGEQEVAELLSLSTRTVRRDWKLARAWLTRALEG